MKRPLDINDTRAVHIALWVRDALDHMGRPVAAAIFLLGASYREDACKESDNEEKDALGCQSGEHCGEIVRNTGGSVSMKEGISIVGLG